MTAGDEERRDVHRPPRFAVARWLGRVDRRNACRMLVGKRLARPRRRWLGSSTMNIRETSGAVVRCRAEGFGIGTTTGSLS
jgi:hypothetical protein